MKRFLSSVALCLVLLLAGLFSFMPSTGAQNNVLPGLLSLPAPPPPNPFYKPISTERDENFFDKKTPPSDNAPIGDLLDYWKHQNQYDPKYTYTVKPSEKALERLMAEVEKKPELLGELIDTFPESEKTAEFVKQLYDAEMANRKFDPSWRTEVKQWLTYHTKYFSNELYQTANQAAETKEYVTNQDEVLALARVDWERAKPILDRMLANPNAPVSQTLARWAYYKHALAVNDTFDIEKYRKELQETVENKSNQPGNRDLAMDALVTGGDYPGRDEWYFSLLEDETLYDLKVNGQTYTGLTTIINHSTDDKYVAKMVELAGSTNPTVRSAAVRNLSTLLDDTITRQNPDIVRALLPWLENPKWARETGGERMKILAALRNFEMPESVPGLIAMLNEKERQTFIPDANTSTTIIDRPIGNVNVANVARAQMIESYPFRSYAVMALEKQRSPQAASALRSILPSVESWERQNVVRALLASNGFSVSEQLEALEETAKNMSQQPQMMSNTNSGAVMLSNTVQTDEPVMAPEISIVRSTTVNSIYNNNPSQTYNPNEIRAMLGQQLVNAAEPSDDLVKAVLDRINFYEKKNPQIATALRQIVQNWKGPAINALLLRDLKDGKSNLFAIVKLVVLRKELREKQLNDVTDIRAGSQTALGISACLLEEPEDFEAILDGGSDEAKTAMLGCARIIRAPLSIPKVAANLKSQNKLLALAAERYLESEDSPEARGIVLSLHPNEARILGAKIAFVPNDYVQGMTSYLPFTRELFISVDRTFEKFPPYFFYSYASEETEEKKLQDEVKESKELLGVYAYDNNFVRIYSDKAVYSWQDDPARYRERVLTVEEFEALKNFFASQRVDELPPFLSACPSCEGKQLLMLGKAGGRRVYVKADPLPQFFAELENIFNEFRQQPAQIHYYLEKDVAGLEILFADDNLGAANLWKNGADFRVLIDDKALHRKNTSEEETETQTEEYVEPDGDEESSEEEMTPERKAEIERERRENQRIARQKEYGSFTWFKFDKSKLLDPVAQPTEVEFIPLVDGFAVQPGGEQWKARAAGVEVRADEDGLYKIKAGQMTRIGKGYYVRPLVTPNGRWALATKFSGDEEDYEGGLVRVNLLTNREYKVKVESDYGAPHAIAFLAGLNKVLLFSSYGESEELSQMSGEFFLLDAETGVVQPVNGEAQPLLQQTFRPLQSVAGYPGLFWVAQSNEEGGATDFGIFNAKTFTFKTLLRIPQISFDSMNMWIDEPEGKIYFVYEGHLLALPLPKNR